MNNYDLLTMSFDSSEGEEYASLIIVRVNGNFTEYIKIFHGIEAMNIYNFLTNKNEKESHHE